MCQGEQKITVDVGTSTIAVVITAEDGSTRSYTIKVTPKNKHSETGHHTEDDD